MTLGMKSRGERERDSFAWGQCKDQSILDIIKRNQLETGRLEESLTGLGDGLKGKGNNTGQLGKS